MVYKGHRQITALPVPYENSAKECQKAICPFCHFLCKGFPYKPYCLYSVFSYFRIESIAKTEAIFQTLDQIFYLIPSLRFLWQQPNWRVFHVVNCIVEVAFRQEVANLQAWSVSLPWKEVVNIAINLDLESPQGWKSDSRLQSYCRNHISIA